MKALFDSGERYRQTVENFPDAIALHDSEGFLHLHRGFVLPDGGRRIAMRTAPSGRVFVRFAAGGAGARDLGVKVFGESDILLVDPGKEHVSGGRQNIEGAGRAGERLPIRVKCC